MRLERTLARCLEARDKLECAERSSSLSGVSATSEKGPATFLPTCRQKVQRSQLRPLVVQEGLIFKKYSHFAIPLFQFFLVLFLPCGCWRGSQARKSVLRRECFPFGAQVPRRGS